MVPAAGRCGVRRAGGTVVAFGVVAMLSTHTTMVLGCCLGALALSGCQSRSVVAHQRGPLVGWQGGTSEAVFHGPEIVAMGVVTGEERSRRDDDLALRPPESAYDQAAWADVRRPSILLPWRVQFETSPTNRVFFVTPAPAYGPRGVAPAPWSEPRRGWAY